MIVIGHWFLCYNLSFSVPMPDTQKWYIVKQKNGQCEIVKNTQVEDEEESERWGPFESQQDAIARRVGLIRAGKCQPA